ncbi:transposase [Pigmentibacter sp. JX0631]|nr:transposase [Pigmentibacter sp. JX0631]WGL61551.1 transposase [Pigmentibacter sp. JX0631]
MDSLPIVLAKGFRAHKCNTAKEISSVGFCSSKNPYYFELKLHLTALFKNNRLASPLSMKITRAAKHDLTAVKNDLLNFNHSELFADRAYCDQSTKQKLA